MPSHQQIERFTLAFHRRAMERLRENPALVSSALEVLDRWESQGMSSAGQTYRDTWRELLAASDLGLLEQAVCAPTDLAATLRSTSPLGFLLEPAERLRIRREVMAA